jgi:hypothetical protein
MAVAVVVGLLSVVGCSSDTPSTDTPASTEARTTDGTPTTDAPTTDVPLTNPPTPSETIGQKNARESAQNYLNPMSFSRRGLIDQLLFEGFSQAEAEYGVRAVGF